VWAYVLKMVWLERSIHLDGAHADIARDTFETEETRRNPIPAVSVPLVGLLGGVGSKLERACVCGTELLLLNLSWLARFARASSLSSWMNFVRQEFKDLGRKYSHVNRRIFERYNCMHSPAAHDLQFLAAAGRISRDQRFGPTRELIGMMCAAQQGCSR
jgi:hypothetical protein